MCVQFILQKPFCTLTSKADTSGSKNYFSVKGEADGVLKKLYREKSLKISKLRLLLRGYPKQMEERSQRQREALRQKKRIKRLFLVISTL